MTRFVSNHRTSCRPPYRDKLRPVSIVRTSEWTPAFAGVTMEGAAQFLSVVMPTKVGIHGLFGSMFLSFAGDDREGFVSLERSVR